MSQEGVGVQTGKGVGERRGQQGPPVAANGAL